MLKNVELTTTFYFIYRKYLLFFTYYEFEQVQNSIQNGWNKYIDFIYD